MKINGVEVVDAKRALTISISPKDVAKGNSKDPAACAAALAAEHLPGVQAAKVHIGRTYLKMNNKWVRYNTSGALRSEIIAFDRGGTFEPGEYKLELVPPSQTKEAYRLAKKRQRDNNRRTRRGRKLTRHVVRGIREHGGNR